MTLLTRTPDYGARLRGGSITDDMTRTVGTSQTPMTKATAGQAKPATLGVEYKWKASSDSRVKHYAIYQRVRPADAQSTPLAFAGGDGTVLASFVANVDGSPWVDRQGDDNDVVGEVRDTWNVALDRDYAFYGELATQAFYLGAG